MLNRILGLLETFVGVVSALYKAYKKKQANDRVSDVRSNPSGVWLEKFGGTDQRNASPSKNSGGDNNK